MEATSTVLTWIEHVKTKFSDQFQLPSILASSGFLVSTSFGVLQSGLEVTAIESSVAPFQVPDWPDHARATQPSPASSADPDPDHLWGVSLTLGSGRACSCSDSLAICRPPGRNMKRRNAVWMSGTLAGNLERGARVAVPQRYRRGGRGLASLFPGCAGASYF